MRRTNQWPTIAMLTTDSALWPRRAGERDARSASAATLVTWLIPQTTTPRLSDDRREHGAGAESIDQPADAERARRADDRGPEIQRGVGDAVEAEIREQRLGDEAEPLRAARQRAHHRQRRDRQHEPAVEETAARSQGTSHRQGHRGRRISASAGPAAP